tara:strand:- start:24048 stop:24440 length:393 start_codon:yes stop_codon:yes gene_type:complete
MTQLSQQEFLDNFIKTFENDGIPCIDLKTTMAVTKAVERRATLSQFTNYIYINNLQNKYTGIYIADFNSNEVDTLAKLVESYNGLHRITTKNLGSLVDDIDLEENELYAVFLTPIDTFKFYLKMTKDKKD